jgi:hypothetical protein
MVKRVEVKGIGVKGIGVDCCEEQEVPMWSIDRI